MTLERCLWKVVIKFKGKCISEKCEGYNQQCEYYNTRFKNYANDKEILKDYEKLIRWKER